MKQTSTILFFLISISVFSQEIVEFRGINRSGWYNETGLLEKWPETGPKIITRIHGFGKGYSQPVFAEGNIFITGIRKDTIDVLSAYNLNGDVLWETPYGRSWTRTYSDSRCTPTWENHRLYVASGTGQLCCINAGSGEIIWQVDAVDNFEGEVPRHGDSESPLVVNDLVVYTTGGEKVTTVAFNKYDGTEVWKTRSLGGAKSYASPVLINYEGKDIILVQTAENLMAVNPVNGEISWHYDLIQYHGTHQGRGAQTNPAIYFNNQIFVTSGYDHPATMFSIAENNQAVDLKWKNTDLNTHHGGVVLVDGKIYGSNWQHNSRGRWACIDWQTGETHWDEEWFNKGSVIYADGMLYLYEEKGGNVALVEPSPQELKIISTFKVDKG
ncbi:MAG: PQQ-binding-like beta-propeller repeat protein, partial [Prolixibacteraceae bacterium]